MIDLIVHAALGLAIVILGIVTIRMSSAISSLQVQVRQLKRKVDNKSSRSAAQPATSAIPVIKEDRRMRALRQMNQHIQEGYDKGKSL